jgi:integrase
VETPTIEVTGMARRDGLYKRGSRWWVRTDPITRKARTTGCKSLAAARDWLKERERLAVNPAYAAAQEATLGYWIGRVIEAKRPYSSDATIQVYEQKLGHFIRLWGEDFRLGDITPDLIDAFVNRRRSEGVVDHTIVKELAKLTTMLRLAKRSGAFHADIESLKPPDLVPNYQPRKRALTREEVVRLLAVLPPPRAALVAVCVALGVRLSEAYRILPSDVDMDAGRVFVGGTKTKASKRWLPVLSLYRPMLAAALPHLPLPLWSNLHNTLATACRRAGIERCTPNDFRRTHSTLLIEAGVDRDVVRRLLGHTTTDMVDRVYGQPRPEALGRLAESRLSGVDPIQVRYSGRLDYRGYPAERVLASGPDSRSVEHIDPEKCGFDRGICPVEADEDSGVATETGAETSQSIGLDVPPFVARLALAAASHRMGVLPTGGVG